MSTSTGYWARTDWDVPEYYPDAETPEEAAREYAEAYDPEWETTWVVVTTWREEDGQAVDHLDHLIEIPPMEPDCVGGHQHDWISPVEVVGGTRESPGVRGHGAGVIMRMICRHCRCYQTIDTWATHVPTGRQGLRSVRYDPPDDRSLAWVDPHSSHAT